MAEYDPQAIEPKWQARWEEAGLFRAGTAGPEIPRFYCLEMLPYPSGRLHMGHVRNYSIGDAVARFQRMRGRDVMHVLGWDAFGLPAENAAIQKGEEPRRWTLANIDAMRAQVRRLGFGYDWSREVATCLPDYYRWNQWFFLRLLERGEAYRSRRALNWCDRCATVLANEQVNDGRCWRCDGPVVRREFDQWFLRITDHAEQLLEGLEALPGWPERIRAMQRHWIGKSGGTRIQFGIEGTDDTVEVFTTRVDTIYGATYVALAIEHPLARRLAAGRPQVEAFISEQMARNLEDRFAEAADKLGVFTGQYAVNPFSGERLPVWIANFVLMDVGTGAIMSVPAHDQRDFEFARRYGLPIVPVIAPEVGGLPEAAAMAEAFPEDGVVHASGPYAGLPSAQARARMTADATARGFGSAVTVYRIKDWGISRQRYWGTPIPVIHCPRCGAVGVPDRDLPVLLPDDPPLTGAGGSPLARVPEFVHAPCPRCGGPGTRETDTMDTFVDSCWYYFRYLDPRNPDAPFDPAKAAPWMPVDLYIGGAEHATMHLIYTRYWTRMMRDLGLTPLDEPVVTLFNQGMVIKDGGKMSKSRGNIVDPDAMIDRYGADTTRLFSLFAAPPERDLEWSEAGVEGCARFLARLVRTFERALPVLAPRGAAPGPGADPGALALRRKSHRTIRRVTDDLGPRMHLNTGVAAIMELLNEAGPQVDRAGEGPEVAVALREAFTSLALLLAPYAPHVAEELWERLGEEGFAARAAWPEADPALLLEEEATVVVQVNGKLRGRLTLPRGASQEEALAAAQGDGKIAPHLAGRTVRKVVHVPDKILNLVVA